MTGEESMVLSYIEAAKDEGVYICLFARDPIKLPHVRDLDKTSQGQN
jgi:hypothetical protein